MQADVPAHRIELDGAALARFMPMHLLLDAEGRALSFGPTLAQVLRDTAVPGARFEELFEVRSPGGARQGRVRRCRSYQASSRSA